jgi:hypothetical protein
MIPSEHLSRSGAAVRCAVYDDLWCRHKIKATPSYNHDDIVREFVKTVVNTPMDYSLARACAAAVDEALAKSAAKS